MKQMICTSYNVSPEGKLTLRNNWLEAYADWVLKAWEIDPSKITGKGKKGTVSDILEGRMAIENVVVHVRILN